jgi:competence protein ComEC
LRAQGISTLDKIIISHAHKDHYDGIYTLIEAGIQVHEVRINFPLEAVCERDRGTGGCDLRDLTRLRKFLMANSVFVAPIRAGDSYYSTGGVQLIVKEVFDGEHTPVGPTDINDTCAVLKRTPGGTSALFAGDLNRHIGEYLAKNGKDLSADILKVPHHGSESLAPNSFFDRVHPKAALVPAPSWLWEGERTHRVREYLKAKNIPTYVNGRDGNVTVTFTDSGYSITSSQAPPTSHKPVSSR